MISWGLWGMGVVMATCRQKFSTSSSSFCIMMRNKVAVCSVDAATKKAKRFMPTSQSAARSHWLVDGLLSVIYCLVVSERRSDGGPNIDGVDHVSIGLYNQSKRSALFSACTKSKQINKGPGISPLNPSPLKKIVGK